MKAISVIYGTAGMLILIGVAVPMTRPLNSVDIVEFSMVSAALVAIGVVTAYWRRLRNG